MIRFCISAFLFSSGQSLRDVRYPIEPDIAAVINNENLIRQEIKNQTDWQGQVMQLLDVPKWLYNRRMLENDIGELQQLFFNNEAPLIGDLSVELLKKFYQEQPKSIFYKVVRLLGFYGVIFTGKLSFYSGPDSTNPKLLSISKVKRQGRLIDFVDNQSLFLLGSCGIKIFDQLHGVPVQSLKKLLNCIPSFETFLGKIPAIITPARADFFLPEKTSGWLRLKEDQKSSEKGPDILKQRFDILNLSVRSSKCLQKKGIETIGDLIRIKSNELLNTKNFGRKSLREITGALSQYNLELVKETGAIDDQNLLDFLRENPDQPVGNLNLSVRAVNCLQNAKILTVGQLVQLSDHELLALQNLGRTTLKELQGKILKLRSAISLPVQLGLFPAQDVLRIDLDNEETLINLTTSVRDLVLSVRTRNALDTHNVEYVWQLISSTEKQLLKIKNFGRKSLNELKEKLSKLDLPLGFVFSQEQILTIQSFEKNLSKQEVDEVLLDKLSGQFAIILNELQQELVPFLGKRENQIAHERLWPITAKRTLEDLASELGVSRERIRQIEKKTRSKIKQQYRKELRGIVSIIRVTVLALGSLSSITHLPIHMYTANTREQFIITELISLMDDSLYFDWNFNLISERGDSWIDQICATARKTIQSLCTEKFFDHNVLDEAITQAILQYKLNKEIIQELLVQKVISREKISSSGGLLCLGRLTKQDKMVLNFKNHFPKGLDIHKQTKQLQETLQKEDLEAFSNASPRSIIGRLVDHPDIFLWGRGFYIHRNNIIFNISIVKKNADWIMKRFDRGHSKFQVELPYSKFAEEMKEGGVPNEYALYTLLRTLNHQRIGQRKFPALVDRLSEVDIYETVHEELEKYLFDAKGPVPHTEIRQEFIEKRGWKQYSLQQHLAAHIETIYPWKDQTYIHLEYLPVNYVKLNELINEIRKKLATIQGAYSLKGAIHEFQVLWHQVCPDATIRTMIKLIRSVEPVDLDIDHYLISFQKETGSETISLAAEIEDYFLEQNIELSTFELKSEFQEIRGWSDNQYYSALRKAHLFQVGKNSFVHPATIHWNRDISEQVYATLNNMLETQNRKGIPHISLSDIIDDYILPELPNDIEWTIELLKNVCVEFGAFLFFNDVCILVGNQFDIEDLDDMIAFLLTRTFEYNLAKKMEVEKLLWRHGVLASGRPIPFNEVFFPESSIKYLSDSDEIKLSQIGIERYVT